MVMRPQLRFVYGQTAFMLAVIVVLSAFGAMAYDLFFMLSFVGFFVLLELTDPFAADPALRTRIRWIAIVGILLFGYILLDRLYDVLVQELP